MNLISICFSDFSGKAELSYINVISIKIIILTSKRVSLKTLKAQRAKKKNYIFKILKISKTIFLQAQTNIIK